MSQNRVIFIENIVGFEDEYTISDIGTVYSKRRKRMVSICLNQGYYRLHLTKDGKSYKKLLHILLAMAFVPNPNNYKFVDHKDRDKTNNSLSNLRWCTQQENSMNQSKQKRETSSKYKGVSWDKSNNKWKAQIKFNNKKIHIGLFDIEIEAALAYNKKAKELSSYYSLNVIDYSDSPIDDFSFMEEDDN